jgi:Tol biopolymer transport system component
VVGAGQRLAAEHERDRGAPALSKDGTTLYFNSDRAGGFGALDLYVSRRVKTKDR